MKARTALLVLIVALLGYLAFFNFSTLAQDVPMSLGFTEVHGPLGLVMLALYGLMIGAPLAGWMILSAADKPIPFYGLQLPALIAPDQQLAGQIKEAHELFGQFGYLLIGGHALAALVHHYLQRDNTLTRMLPSRRSH